MAKIQTWRGIVPKSHQGELARFKTPCPSCKKAEEWILFQRGFSRGWLNIKLVANGRVCRKANYKLGATKDRAPTFLARDHDAGLLANKRTALYKELISFLAVRFSLEPTPEPEPKPNLRDLL